VVLELKDVNALNDKGLPALRDVSLTVRAGEILGVAAWPATANPSWPRSSPACARPSAASAN